MRSIDGRDDGKVEWNESRGCDASAAFVIRVKPASQPALGLKSGLLMDNFGHCSLFLNREFPQEKVTSVK